MTPPVIIYHVLIPDGMKPNVVTNGVTVDCTYVVIDDILMCCHPGRSQKDSKGVSLVAPWYSLDFKSTFIFGQVKADIFRY